MKHILISVKPIYVQRIIDGSKSVEVRRRRVLFDPGSIVWIYATKPIASIVGLAEVGRVETGKAEKIWIDNRAEMGISKTVFTDYVRGAPLVSAIHLENVVVLDEAVTLDMIREYCQKFHPPQFFNYLGPKNSLRKRLEQIVA